MGSVCFWFSLHSCNYLNEYVCTLGDCEKHDKKLISVAILVPVWFGFKLNSCDCLNKYVFFQGNYENSESKLFMSRF